MLRQAIVSHPKALVPEAGAGEWVILDAAYVGGQSGAPLVNPEGDVVGLVQMSTDRVGLSRSADVIRDRVGRFFEKKKSP
jgi:S1-C subfamily serine protease